MALALLHPAVGFLDAPSREIEGFADFDGPVIHSAQWLREGIDLTGKRVAIIGTGSSGVQLIPKIAERAESLTVLQRSPMWVVPLQNTPMPLEYRTRIKVGVPGVAAAASSTSRSPATSSSTGDASFGDAVGARGHPGGARGRVRVPVGGRRALAVHQLRRLDLQPEANDTLRDFLERKVRGMIRIGRPPTS